MWWGLRAGHPYGLCCYKLLIVTIILADFALQGGGNVLVHKCMTVSWTWKCLCIFWRETFCRIAWGSPVIFLHSCWKTHAYALVEEKSKGIITNTMLIWNSKKQGKSVGKERRPDKLEQSVAHFCSCEGLCTHSDPDEGKWVIQVKSTPQPQCSLLLAWRNYPAASRGQKEPGSLAKTDVWSVCG